MTKHRITEWERMALTEVLKRAIETEEIHSDHAKSLVDIIENADYISTSSEEATPEPFHVSYKIYYKDGKEYSDGEDYATREDFEIAYEQMLAGYVQDLAVIENYTYWTDSDSWTVVQDGKLWKKVSA